MAMKIRWSAQIVALLLLLAIPVITYADPPTKIVTCTGAECSLCDLANTGQNILNTAIYLLVVLSAVLFAWAGFKMLLSGGDTAEYAQGKRVFSNVIIGLVIVLTGWMVVNVVMTTLLKKDPQWPWNKICTK